VHRREANIMQSPLLSLELSWARVGSWVVQKELHFESDINVIQNLFIECVLGVYTKPEVKKDQSSMTTLEFLGVIIFF